ncbi:MAG: hypothetical protein JWR59_1072 [Brevundimonas sp.]|nr:hypothetical protein [Brevundimonas sp.]
MSCGIALSLALLMTDPNVALAAAVPAVVADAPISVASEPLFRDIISRSSSLKSIVDAWKANGAADASGFFSSPDYTGFHARAVALSETDMQAHLVLKERGTDADLKCILRGISEDIPKKIAAIEAATTPSARAVALDELSYLLNDNVEVITTPPQHDAQSGLPAG